MIIDIGYEVKNLKTLLITIQGIICHRTIKPCYFKAYYKTLSIPQSKPILNNTDLKIFCNKTIPYLSYACCKAQNQFQKNLCNKWYLALHNTIFCYTFAT